MKNKTLISFLQELFYNFLFSIHQNNNQNPQCKKKLLSSLMIQSDYINFTSKTYTLLLLSFLTIIYKRYT